MIRWQYVGYLKNQLGSDHQMYSKIIDLLDKSWLFFTLYNMVNVLIKLNIPYSNIQILKFFKFRIIIYIISNLKL